MTGVDFSALATGGIKELSPYLPGKPIEELERELGITQIIKLASNENPRGPSQKVQQAIQQASEKINRYPDTFNLTEKLASHYKLKEEQITLANGSNQVLNSIAQVFLSAQDNAIISEHAFIVYAMAVKQIGATLKIVPALNYGHDLQKMAEAIDENTRLIFIANPNNPTGTWNTGQAVAGFLEKVPPSVVVVLDEAYAEYANEKNNSSHQFKSAISLLAQYPNLIVTRTFSKAYGLAGLRVGYALSSIEISNLLNRVREPFNVNAIALLAAEAALDDADYLQSTCELNSEGMSQLEAGLNELNLKTIPSIANFITVEFEQDATLLYERLLQEGVIVRPVSIYGLPKHLRLSIGLPEENQRLLDALKKIVRQKR